MGRAAQSCLRKLKWWTKGQNISADFCFIGGEGLDCSCFEQSVFSHSRLNSHWTQTTPSSQMFNLQISLWFPFASPYRDHWCYQNIQSFSATTVKIWIHQQQKFSRKSFPCPSPCEDEVPRWNWAWQLTGSPTSSLAPQVFACSYWKVSARPSQTSPWLSFPSRCCALLYFQVNTLLHFHFLNLDLYH